ncbi:L-dopachrome tautomerase-related protein [Aristophania vespae]|uniref:L-dopachrome tautomerase-related protein n=1 Tax=Aristophania vespae TaxID=2697033 RepID=UPI0023511F94|nr:L-dopachrome tautomerase-related protein [Aristophania vespae]
MIMPSLLFRSSFAPLACLFVLYGTPAFATQTSALTAAKAPDRTSQTLHIYELPQVSDIISPVITSLADGTIYSLDKEGKITNIDLKNGQVRNFSTLPGFSAITGNDKSLWAVSQGPEIELYNISGNGTVLRHISLQNVIVEKSRFSALQVNDEFAFLADEGSPALVIIDLKSGKARRVLEWSQSLSAQRPYKRDGQLEKTAKGQVKTGGNVRYLALTHDGKRLFYQTPAGPFYSIDTALLTDPSLSPAELLEAMDKWRNKYSIGGLTITKDDTLYMIDVEHGDLIEIIKNQHPTRLAHDSRLTQAEDMTLCTTHPHSKSGLIVLTKARDKNSASPANSSLAAPQLLEIDLPS